MPAPGAGLMLEIESASVVLGGVTVLSAISARVDSGGWLGLVGPNGAGKSTLARAVAGLVAYQGRIVIAGRDHGSSDWRDRPGPWPTYRSGRYSRPR